MRRARRGWPRWLCVLLGRLRARLDRFGPARRFMAAADARDLGRFRALFQAHGRLDFAVPGQRNLLVHAAAAGAVDIVRFIVEVAGGIPAAECTARGDNALLAAGFANRAEVVGYLLARPEFDRDFSDRDGNTLLIIACANGHAALVRALLAAEPPAEVNARNALGQTALHRAARHGQTEVVCALLQCARVELCPRDINGDTPFHLAAAHFHVATLRQLLAGGDCAEPLHERNHAEESPLLLVLRHLDAFVRRRLDADRGLRLADAERYVLAGEPPAVFAVGLGLAD